MIAYALDIVEGCIHKPFIKVQMGTTIVAVDCVALKTFIQEANNVGLEQALELFVAPEQHELLTFLYNEFYDKIE